MTGTCPTCGETHRGVSLGPPKTASGEARRVDLGDHVVGALLAHRLAQDTHKSAWLGQYHDHDLVFAREDGMPFNPTRFTSAFQQLCKAAGLRHIRLHDLRHGRASMLMASGTDIAMVSKMLGHSSIAITADTYSHMLDGIGRKAADALIPRRARNPRDQPVTNLGESEGVPAPEQKGAGR